MRKKKPKNILKLRVFSKLIVIVHLVSFLGNLSKQGI